MDTENDNRALKICFISQVKREKGIIELIISSLRLPEAEIDAYGEFEGDLTKAIFYRSNVNYKGIAGDKNLRGILEGYDILIIPRHDRNDVEVIKTAADMRLAVILSSTEGVSNVVLPERNAVILDHVSADEIVKVIRMLEQDRTLLKGLKRNN
ncbi:MAG: hypothetical protein ACM3S2_12335 [Ignavibacteriales bacterium]